MAKADQNKKLRSKKLRSSGGPSTKNIIVEEITNKANSDNPIPDGLLKTKSRFWLLHPDPIVKLTGWIAAFTGCLLIVGAIQTWAYIQRERSVVSVASVKLTTNFFVANQPFMFLITYRNTGGVAAKPISVFVGSSSHELPGPMKYLIGKTDLPNFIIPPGQEIQQVYTLPEIDGLPRILSEEQVKMLESGQVRVFVYGQMRYVDSFNILNFWPEKTQFCYEYALTGGPEKKGIFILCRTELIEQNAVPKI